MAGSRSSSRCLNCGGLFEAVSRNRGRQRFCSAQACRKPRKRHGQARWLHQPANADYFKGPNKTERVRQWRARNPGYWKRPKKSADPTGDSRKKGSVLVKKGSSEKGSVLDIVQYLPNFLRRYNRWFR